MSAKLLFPAGEHLVVRFEHGNPGVSGGASRIDLGKELGDKLVRDADVIRIAEVALEAFEATDKLLEAVLVEQAPEKLVRVAKLLDCNSQLVPLAGREAAEPLPALPYLAPAPVEHAGGNSIDRRSHRIRLIRCRMPAPAGPLEPPQ